MELYIGLGVAIFSVFIFFALVIAGLSSSGIDFSEDEESNFRATHPLDDQNVFDKELD